MAKKSMRRLSIEETWKECLRMWKWISQHCCGDDVGIFKQKWLDKHGYLKTDSGCFFCAYAKSSGIYSNRCLAHCPARKVDPDFICDDCSYSFLDQPEQFYQKLVELNKILLKKKVGARK